MEIEKYYRTRNNRKKALDQVSFSVNLGDFVSIMEASGSGKTSQLCEATDIFMRISDYNIFLQDGFLRNMIPVENF